ncbi:phosphoglycerate kinase [Patescibacteria group bacterium]|nr:phosphoglycerate kinase [Patescibacteria group bacterium]
MKLKTLEKDKIENKTVLVRADLDVPLKDGEVEDSARLEAVVRTLEFLFKNKAKVVLIGHLGRPDPQSSISNFQLSKENEKFSLEPVVRWFYSKFKNENEFPKNEKIGDFYGWRLDDNFSILENLRFYKEEKENDLDFSKKLTSLADCYVNDAFAVSHRTHSSVVGVCKFIPHFAGLRLQEEVDQLSIILEKPARPLVVIIGGVKIETKLPVVKNMHGRADYILVGGKIAEQMKILFNEQHQDTERKSILLVADLTEDKNDITQKSAENFAQIIKTARMVVWNGPLGFTEQGFDKSSRIVSQSIVDSEAYSVIGGGDTGACLKKLGYYDKFSFVSMGGGAMLDFLSGQKLPGLEVLKQ